MTRVVQLANINIRQREFANTLENVADERRSTNDVPI